MQVKKPIVRIIIGAVAGLAAGAVLEFAALGVSFPALLIFGLLIGISVALIIELVRYRRSVRRSTAEGKGLNLERLPADTVTFIKLIIKKMRYRKKIRDDVMAELAAHFEDALKDCKTGQEKAAAASVLIGEFGDAKLLGILLRRAKKRCRPLWRTVVARTCQTIGVLILCFIAYCAYISLGKPTISINYIEEATRIARPVVDESLNAAPLYQKAIAAYKKPPIIEIEVPWDPRVRAEAELFGEKSSRTPTRTEKHELLNAIADKGWIGDLSEKELSALQQWLPTNAEAAKFFKQASERPHCWWQRQAKNDMAIVTLMPELSGVRDMVKMMGWHAKLNAYDGDVEQALDDLLACYRAGRHFKGPRCLIEQLVGMSIQNLATRNLFIILNNRESDTQLLKNLQNQVEELVSQDTFIVNYEVERFLGLDFIQRCYTDNGRGSGHMIPGRLREFWIVGVEEYPDSGLLGYGRFLLMALAGADRRDMSLAIEDVYRTGEKWAGKTPWQLREEEIDTLAGWSQFKRARYWPVGILAPAAARVSALAHQRKTETEALITTIAALRYRQQHGVYPENLGRLLDASLLSKLPMDPYSDKPLTYKATQDSFTLYSVGENFADDNGRRQGSSWEWGDHRTGDRVFWPVETYRQRTERLGKKSSALNSHRLNPKALSGDNYDRLHKETLCG